MNTTRLNMPMTRNRCARCNPCPPRICGSQDPRSQHRTRHRFESRQCSLRPLETWKVPLKGQKKASRKGRRWGKEW